MIWYRYGVERLQGICEEHLKRHMRGEDVWDILMVAEVPQYWGLGRIVMIE